MKRCRYVFFCDIQYDENHGSWWTREKSYFDDDDVDDGEDDHA